MDTTILLSRNTQPQEGKPSNTQFRGTCIDRIGKELVRHLQLDDVADGVVLVGAVALDARVHVGGVDGCAVRGRADARVAGEPWRPHLQPELGKHHVQRLRYK